MEITNGITRNEFNYSLTYSPVIFADGSVISQIDTGRGMVLKIITLDRVVERNTLMNKRPRRVDTEIGTKKVNFQLKLRNRF